MARLDRFMILLVTHELYDPLLGPVDQFMLIVTCGHQFGVRLEPVQVAIRSRGRSVHGQSTAIACLVRQLFHAVESFHGQLFRIDLLGGQGHELVLQPVHNAWPVLVIVTRRRFTDNARRSLIG